MANPQPNTPPDAAQITDRELLITLIRQYDGSDRTRDFIELIRSGRWDNEALLTSIRLFRLSAEKAAAARGYVNYEELAIEMGQTVTITFKDRNNAFALFNELKARGAHAPPTSKDQNDG